MGDHLLGCVDCRAHSDSIACCLLEACTDLDGCALCNAASVGGQGFVREGLDGSNNGAHRLLLSWCKPSAQPSVCCLIHSLRTSPATNSVVRCRRLQISR